MAKELSCLHRKEVCLVRMYMCAYACEISHSQWSILAKDGGDFDISKAMDSSINLQLFEGKKCFACTMGKDTSISYIAPA